MGRVGKSPREYARYHLWRRYWRILLNPPLCELCYRLHHPEYSPDLAHGYTPVRNPSFDVSKSSTNNHTSYYRTTRGIAVSTSPNVSTSTTSREFYAHNPSQTNSVAYTRSVTAHNSFHVPIHVPSTSSHPNSAPSLDVWWLDVNNCTTLYPLAQYPRIDMDVLGRRLLQEAELLENKVKLLFKGRLSYR